MRSFLLITLSVALFAAILSVGFAGFPETARVVAENGWQIQPVDPTAPVDPVDPINPIVTDGQL
jgi:hypothetical protein